jgi:hypothetical protein
MIPPNSKVYLETSAVNLLADKYLGQDGKATKIFHGVRGTDFYISPVTIWEILLTNDPGRREVLIYYIQNIAHRELINSPAEFIVNYIKAGCPLEENKYKFHSKSSLSTTWTDICDNPAKTFVFEKDNLDKMSKSIRAGFSEANKMIEDLGITGLTLNEKQQSQHSLEQLLKAMKTIKYEEMTDRNRRQFKISLILILIILCYGIGFADNAVESFWAKLKVSDTTDRFHFIITHHESLIYRGPFAVLSEMVLTQMEKGAKPTRGIFWDVLHSIYLVYTDYFFTADLHFKLLRDKNDHLNYKKIVFLPEVTIFTAKEIEITGHGIIK